MIRSFFFLLLSVVITSCQRPNNYLASAHLSAQEQDARLALIIRYMAPPPDGLSLEERSYKVYDDHYSEQQTLHRLDAYYIGEDNKQYFLVSRIAPSLVEKRVAIGGVLQLDKDGRLAAYEELFRTWKMAPDTLASRSMFLFDKMVSGEKLNPWYSSQSGNTDYIEFPDNHTHFDAATRTWKTK